MMFGLAREHDPAAHRVDRDFLVSLSTETLRS